MSLIVLNRHVVLNGRRQKCIFLPTERARALWLVKTGERKGTAKQRAFAQLVDRVYLKREVAPDSYKKAYPEPEQMHNPYANDQLRLPYKD